MLKFAIIYAQNQLTDRNNVESQIKKFTVDIQQIELNISENDKARFGQTGDKLSKLANDLNKLNSNAIPEPVNLDDIPRYCCPLQKI